MKIKEHSLNILRNLKENGIMEGIKNNWNGKINSLITKNSHLIEKDINSILNDIST